MIDPYPSPQQVVNAELAWTETEALMKLWYPLGWYRIEVMLKYMAHPAVDSVLRLSIWNRVQEELKVLKNNIIAWTKTYIAEGKNPFEDQIESVLEDILEDNTSEQS